MISSCASDSKGTKREAETREDKIASIVGRECGRRDRMTNLSEE